MSYDLTVYGRRSAATNEILRAVTSASGLTATPYVDDSLVVLRGASPKYSFTVEGPADVKPADAPEGVTAAVLAVTHQYSVLVEGSATAEIPHAVRFARRLAQTLDGAVHDHQTDEVWSRSSSRTTRRPAREDRVTALELRWYVLREQLRDPATLLLDSARRYLPEALPRRFGEYEPLQGKLAAAEPDAFQQAWAAATSTLFIAGSGPCTDGHLDAGPGDRHPDRFWSMSLTFLADTVRAAGWRDALRDLLVTVADALPAFYASATLEAGHVWSGRSLWSDANTEWAVLPVRRREGWTGLPPVRALWTWLGEPFAEFHRDLPSDRTGRTARGVLYAADGGTGIPATLVPLSQWVPGDLFSRLAPNPDRSQPVPLVRATMIPAALA